MNMNLIALFNEMYNKFMEEYFKSETNKKYFSNMSNKDVSYLSQIHKNKRISELELSRKIGVSKSATTQIIDKLIKKGIVIKERSFEDGRSVKLNLSQNANKLFVENDKELEKILNNKLDFLSKEEKDNFFLTLI